MFLRPYVGEGPALIRALAKAAEEAAAEYGFAMILLDDFEYSALHRGVGDHSSPAYSAVTASLITVMQGLGKRNPRVTFVATVNRPDLVDAALLRAGRFTTRIEIPRPGYEACRRILDVHLAKVPLADGLTREAATELLARRIFGTADDNLLLRIHFADAEQEEVFPSRLINGAILEATVRGACLSAIARDRGGGRVAPGGVQQQDLLVALDEQLRAARKAITPRNIHQCFLEVPPDRRVVAIDQVSSLKLNGERSFVE